VSLKDERIKAGYSQAEVAEVCGVNQSAYSHYETGRRNPKLKTVEKLANLYGISIEDLLKESNDTGRTGSEAGKTA